MGIPCTELVFLMVEHLDTAAEQSHPDTMPAVLYHTPHTVVGQLVGLTQGTVVDNRSFTPRTSRGGGYTMDKSTVVGAEPETAIGSQEGGHDDVTHHGRVGGGVVL